MDRDTASLIVRATTAVNNHSDGYDEHDADAGLIAQALELAGGDVHPGMLWWAEKFDPGAVTFADPWKRCVTCRWWVDGYRPASGLLIPCGHKEYEDVCTSWGPVNGCRCASHGWEHAFRKRQPGDDRVY